MAEDGHQAALFTVFEMHYGRWPELKLAFHPANGGLRDPIVAAKLAGQGVRAGVSDIVLPAARRGYFGLYLELKNEGKTISAVTREQAEFLFGVGLQGYLPAWAAGAERAWRIVHWYLSGPVTKVLTS